jgi:hypothetical protein
VYSILCRLHSLFINKEAILPNYQPIYKEAILPNYQPINKEAILPNYQHIDLDIHYVQHIAGFFYLY